MSFPEHIPTYCEACGVKISGVGFIDEAKTVIWHGLCQDCKEVRFNSENENKSVSPLDIE